MKKLFVLSAAVLLTVAVNAQTDSASIKKDEATLNKEKSFIKKEKKVDRKALRKLEGKEVSSQSKQAFFGDFGNITVSKWERIANYDKATFTKEGQVMTAYYDFDSKLVGTTSYKTLADLPFNAQKQIDTKFQGYTKAGVIFFDDNETNETDMIMYDYHFDDADSYFVELKKDDKEIILQVNMSGDVSFFKQLL